MQILAQKDWPAEYVTFFKGLKELSRLTGEDFICGVVIYRGNKIVPFEENMWAVPVDAVWA